jgi:hypothetical protein
VHVPRQDRQQGIQQWLAHPGERQPRRAGKRQHERQQVERQGNHRRADCITEDGAERISAFPVLRVRLPAPHDQGENPRRDHAGQLDAHNHQHQDDDDARAARDNPSDDPFHILHHVHLHLFDCGRIPMGRIEAHLRPALVQRPVQDQGHAAHNIIELARVGRIPAACGAPIRLMPLDSGWGLR